MNDSGIQLEVTQEAQDQVRDLIKAQKPGTAVRVYLQTGSGGGCGCGSGGGGCGCGGGGGGHGGGPTFGMAFDKPRNGDKVIPVDGFSIVVDDLSAEMLNGARIDYVQELNQTGFKIIAPQLGADPEGHGAEGAGSGGCGCGSGGCGCG
ncbi:MAG TPA: iron-sulfur cluster biosynthesis family protein [Thermoplasmata archaeon]|jgi:Fe-S cluster assembly iron-binding protein IscA|nr:iron-sulfur cluster biosynthesis family protein [Thermoplasmata archaeon]